MSLSTLALAATLLQGPPPGAPDAAATRRLHALFDEAWQFRLREDPLFATSAGDHRFDDRLPSVTPADQARRREALAGFQRRLAALRTARLGDQDRLSSQVLERELWRQLRELELGLERIPIDSDSGFHADFADLPSVMPFRTAADYRNYLARLRDWPRWLAEELAAMRAGLAAGFTLPRVALRGVDANAEVHVVADPEASIFYAPFRAFPAAVPEGERARLRAEGRAAVAEAVVPGYRDFVDFLRREYIPGARTTVGAADLPGGAGIYAFEVKRYTTLDLSPRQIHERGLAEVARIQAEMETVIRKTGFTGDFAAFVAMLRTDPRFYARTPEELLSRAARIAKRMDGRLPSLFGRLPRLPYGVDPVPDHLAPNYTGGRYVPAPPGGTRAGTYWVNTFRLESRPLYVLESLTLHEAVPGHHLEFALSSELEALPPFRRFASVDAYSEGWALYAERLGLEAGFYTDPYSEFGRLTYEMWRACRLVVDTGLHALGWSREQAVAYLAGHTALSLHEVETETDRYISWPGQALAYKMGELEIRALRHQAEEALGPRFDLRAFHDAVLANGPIALPELRDQIEAWIVRQAGPRPGRGRARGDLLGGGRRGPLASRGRAS
jgi:uncharacterized protein (DUF885 family)